MSSLWVDDLFDDAFPALARDGATVVELGRRVQTALLTLSRLDHPDFEPARRRHSREVLPWAELALSVDPDKDRLRQLPAQV